ncbi:hypothetical protein A2U01_0059345, partial [Trifolium medium]|nr:hypothetical protein [Trifolium medium]
MSDAASDAVRMRLQCGRTRELKSHRNCGTMRLQRLPHPQYCGRNCGCGP